MRANGLRAWKGNQIRRTARDEGGRAGWTLKTHQPDVVSSLSGPIELESKRATDAAATGADSVCRAWVRNGAGRAAW